MSDDTIRVVIADDHTIVREGIRSVLEAAGDLDVVGEAATGAEALRLVDDLSPDVLVLDISMPEGSGLDVTRQLRAGGSTVPRVLILSIYDDTEFVVEAVRAGAAGYLRKDSSPAELRDAVRTVHRGDEYFSPAVARRLSSAIRDGSPRRASTPLDVLTSREREVLALVATGLTNKEVAARLGISHRTVESHREHLVKKLGVQSVAELTKLALKSGLIAD